MYILYLFQCFSTALVPDYGATYLIPGGKKRGRGRGSIPAMQQL